MEISTLHFLVDRIFSFSQLFTDVSLKLVELDVMSTLKIIQLDVSHTSMQGTIVLLYYRLLISRSKQKGLFFSGFNFRVLRDGGGEGVDDISQPKFFFPNPISQF